MSMNKTKLESLSSNLTYFGLNIATKRPHSKSESTIVGTLVHPGAWSPSSSPHVQESYTSINNLSNSAISPARHL
jgi:hypothetical protein